jgi:hypothetical protein
MTLRRNACTIGLILASLLVLLLQYRFVSIGELSLTAGPLSLGKLSVASVFPAIAAVAILLGLGICHVVHQWHLMAGKFHSGYSESPAFVELVRAKVADAANTDRYGSPYGGLAPSFRKRSFEIGRFLRVDEVLSELVVVSPDMRTHLGAVLAGTVRALSWRLFAPVYAPILLCIWALCSVA